MKISNKIARKITAYNKTVEQFIQECKESGKFNSNQMKEIRLGFENSLTMEQVKVYAKPEFKGYPDYINQMAEIRYGFENGLTMEQVKFYADPKFSGDFMGQMEAMRRGFKENNLTIEQVKLYADPKFKFLQMYEIIDGFKNGLMMEEVKVYAKPEFNWQKMKQIRKDLEKRYVY